MPEQIQAVKTFSIAKVLRDADKKPTIAEKVALLKRHESVAMRELIRHAFEPSIKYDVSTDPKPADPKDYSRATQNDPNLYHPQNDDGTNEGAIQYEVRRRVIYLLEGGPGEMMTPNHRDDLFKDILESINPYDAELLLAIKDKTWPFASLTPAVINQAFPLLLTMDASVKAAVAADVTPTVAPKAKPKAKAKKKVAKKATKK